MRLNPRNIVKLIEDHFRFHPETEITAEERGLFKMFNLRFDLKCLRIKI